MGSEESENFAFSGSSRDTRKEFRDLTAGFLNAKTYHEAEDRGRQLMLFILTHHDKVQALAPVLENLNVFELYGKYEFIKQRLHFSHQVNVFLLGLYIYHNFEPLRREVNLEVQRTTPNIKIENRYYPFRYSGGSKYGEFLYRWRLVALCHDIGTGIQLCEGNHNQIKRCLELIPFEKKVTSLDELLKIDSHNLLRELDVACKEVRLSDYMAHQNSHPFPNSVHHDHGIVSALILLRLMHEEYARHLKDPISYTRFGEVVWHPKILSNSILQLATTIAMHNLEKYPGALQKYTKDARIFDMQYRPVTWLLKISDILQEWDKPKVIDVMKSLPITTLKLDVSQSKILVKNFPKERRDEAVRVLHSYTKPNDIVRV